MKSKSTYVTSDSHSASLSYSVKHPSGAYDQIFITVRQLRVCWYGALSLTKEKVCRIQLLLVLASEVILWSESIGTRDHILLSQIRDSPPFGPRYIASERTPQKTPFPTLLPRLHDVVMGKDDVENTASHSYFIAYYAAVHRYVCFYGFIILAFSRHATM
jgi:hypothetical protein